MWYAIISEDVENSLEKRKSVRPAHVERLQDLANAGKLLTAGPHPAIDSEDPYIEAGVYKQVTIKPFKKVLP
jgi:uncharacterized protein YciI